MTTHPDSLDELTRDPGGPRPWLASLLLPDIGGGQQSADGLAALQTMPAATALEISGLDQATFEVLVSRYGHQFRGLQFWKCPRIEDLTPLEDLDHLEFVGFYWNQRATGLWNFARTPRLRGLEFRDFTRLHDLGDLSSARSLEELSFGDKVWPTSVFKSLYPLEALGMLRRLAFDARKLEDSRIQPLARLTRIEELQFPSNLFTTEQIAWLMARLPRSVKGAALGPIRRYDPPIGEGDKSRDVLVVGKRKPWLHSQMHVDRITRYETAFWKLVADFRQNAAAEPE